MKKQEILYKHTRRRESNRKEEGEAEGQTPCVCGVRATGTIEAEVLVMKGKADGR